MIKAASIRSQIKQIEEIETQINTFRVKYDCLPGDCANAQTFFGTTDANGNGIYNGDGNGSIQGTANGTGGVECLQPSISGEVTQLFLHLYLAGLNKDYDTGYSNASSKIGVNYPYAKFDNGTGLIVSCLTRIWNNDNATPAFLASGNILTIGISGSSTGGTRIGYSTGQLGIFYYGMYGSSPSGSGAMNPIGIPVDVARQIDRKIDDGKPSSSNFGIIAGQVGCDNAALSNAGNTLLSAYPAPSVVCNVTAGKKIN